jgi:reactive intermediate/imine deaminase
VASQGPIDLTTNEFVQGPFEAQAARVLENVKAIVEAAGASLAQVVKVNAYLTNMSDFDAFNRVYRTYFSEPYPPRTTIQSDLGFLVSVDVIVALEDQ